MGDIDIPVFEMPTTYTISALPLEHEDALLYEITVEWRSADRWAVCRPKRCLGADGQWDWESIPSEREDEWLATHRFDRDTALRMAREAAPNVRINGRTAREVAAAIGATP